MHQRLRVAVWRHGEGGWGAASGTRITDPQMSASLGFAPHESSSAAMLRSPGGTRWGGIRGGEREVRVRVRVGHQIA